MRDYSNEENYLKAKKRVDNIKGFFIHLLVYVIVNIGVSTSKIVCNIKKGETFSEAIFDFSTFVLWMAWGIGVTFHGFAVITESTGYFKDWKNKKLKRYIDEEIEEFKRSNNKVTLDLIEDFSKKEAYFRAKKRLDNLSGFYWHAVVYLVVNAFIFSILFFVADLSITEWYTYATAIFWGLGLIIHGISLFIRNVVFSKNWEQRKIEEYMRNDQQECWD